MQERMSLGERTCAVLSPFGEPYDQYYQEVYSPAIKDAGLVPTRADCCFRPGSVREDIYRMIDDAAIVLADLTTGNLNVSIEIGYAFHGHKPVILIAEAMQRIPFNLQGLRVILYDKNCPSWGANLRWKVARAIDEALTKAKEKSPTG